MDIQRYNYIDSNDEMRPINKQYEFETLDVMAFFTDHNDIIIAGTYNTYGNVWWLSVTNISEEDEIRNIFDYVSKLKPTECTKIDLVIQRTNYTYEQLKQFHYTIPKTADDIFEYHQRIKLSILEQEKGGKYHEIQEYNLMTPEKINYMPNPHDRLIKVYYGNDNDVIIDGVADNNYIYWYSVTKMDDVETNRKILEWLNFCVPTKFGYEYIAIKKTKYTFEQIKHFYSTDVKNVDEISQKKVAAITKSKTEGLTLIQIIGYIMKLSVHSVDPVRTYEKNEELIELIQSQTFLHSSNNPVKRILYNLLYNICENIYQAYMRKIR